MTGARRTMGVVVALLLVLTACSKGGSESARAGSDTDNATDSSDTAASRSELRAER